MAPHAEDASVARSSSGQDVAVGQAPLEPGVKKNIAEGKMISFPG